MKQSIGNKLIVGILIVITAIVFFLSFTKTYVQFIGADSFQSDGCSLFPDAIGKSKYGSCCRTHDRSYYNGGSVSDRKAADDALYSCVAQEGSTALATAIYWGVRIGGTPYLPTSFRWNFGADYGNFYSDNY